jgi:hypothetical protein
MSDIKEIVNSIEIRSQKILKKMDDLQIVNQNLLKELSESNQKIILQDLEIKKLNTSFDAMKITNSLLGSDEYKRDTKFKINSLIREIDYCIAQLSD